MKISIKKIIEIQTNLLKSYIADYYDEASTHERKLQAQMAIISIWDFLKMLGVKEMKINRIDRWNHGMNKEVTEKIKEEFGIKIVKENPKEESISKEKIRKVKGGKNE